MILQALLSCFEALAEKDAIFRPGWGKGKVSYALEIDIEGKLLAIHSLQVSLQNGKKMVPREMKLPARVKKLLV